MSVLRTMDFGWLKSDGTLFDESSMWQVYGGPPSCVRPMGSNPTPTWLLFDGDCRVCAALAACLRTLDLRGHLRIQPIQQSRDLLQGVSPEEALEAVHAVDSHGRVATGPEAVPLVLAALSGVPRLEELLRSSPPAVSVLSQVYRVLIGVRAHLSCRVDSFSSAVHAPR